jgi:uncharacterized protein
VSGAKAEVNSAPSVISRTKDRIPAIDILRGLALLGVLIVNVDTEFRATFFEQFLAPHYGSTTDQITRGVISFFIEFKAITIFSTLFGVGLAIQYEALERHGRAVALLFRRLLVLLAFGLAHLFLVWNGDILTAYAIAGLCVLPYLLGPTWLIGLASLAALLIFLCLPLLPIHFAFPKALWIAQHVVDARRVYGEGSFLDILAFRIREIPQVWVYDFYILPRTIGLILFGAFAWRSGVLRDLRGHRTLVATAAAVGLVGGVLLTWLNGSGVSPPTALVPAVAHVVDTFAPIVLAVGYSASLLYLASILPFGRLLVWAAPVGRMAFTNYLSQSVVLGLLFYGYGFGWLGHVGVTLGLAISISLYAAQVLISAWWLRSHHFGPLEWLWRTAMYGERQPWAKRLAA